MKVFDAAAIRNVALVGHSGGGKTQLASALLFDAGATNRFGKVDDGTTVTDYDEEAIARKHTLSASLAFLEWNKLKVNLIDTPGHGQLPGRSARGAARRRNGGRGRGCRRRRPGVHRESVGGSRGTATPPHRRVQPARPRAGQPRARARIDAQRPRPDCIPVQIPIGEEKAFTGVVDLVAMKAYTFAGDDSGKMTEGPVPDAMAGGGRRGAHGADRDGRRGR